MTLNLRPSELRFFVHYPVSGSCCGPEEQRDLWQSRNASELGFRDQARQKGNCEGDIVPKDDDPFNEIYSLIKVGLWGIYLD